jgi:hypothetical protein
MKPVYHRPDTKGQTTYQVRNTGTIQLEKVQKERTDST